MKQVLKIAGLGVGLIILLAVSGTYGASYYYSSEHGQGCASCHEMAAYVSEVHGAPHRSATCMDCHVASLSTKLRHIRVHLMRTWPEAIRLRDVDVVEMVPNCQKCHQQEYATWHAGPTAPAIPRYLPIQRKIPISISWKIASAATACTSTDLFAI